MMIPPFVFVFFFLFLFFILIFRAVRRRGGGEGMRRGDGKKWPKMRNNYIRHASYLGNGIAYDHNFWYTYVKW